LPSRSGAFFLRNLPVSPHWLAHFLLPVNVCAQHEWYKPAQLIGITPPEAAAVKAKAASFFLLGKRALLTNRRKSCSM
jgi:hypothetical protein